MQRRNASLNLKQLLPCCSNANAFQSIMRVILLILFILLPCPA
jgi:hypothetical protein